MGRGWAEVEFKQPVEIDRILWGRDGEGKFTDRVPTRYRIDVSLVAPVNPAPPATTSSAQFKLK